MCPVFFSKKVNTFINRNSLNCIYVSRFGFDSELFPKFGDVERKYNLDAAVEASGFSKEMEKDFDEASFCFKLNLS